MAESQITKLVIQMAIVIIVEQRYLFYFNAAVKKSTLARLQLDTVHFWAPKHKQDRDLLAQTQHIAAEMVKG